VVDRVLSEGSAEWTVGGRTHTLKRAFVEDVRAAALHDKIRGLRLPLLILHSPTDNTVGIANASEIFRTANIPAASFPSRVRTIWLPAPARLVEQAESSAHGRTHISSLSNQYHICSA
jgi:hypothetical protein